MRKLAVFFPGMGYTHDKPLLYYSRKLATEHGYEVVGVEYHDLPNKIRGDREKMILAAGMAYEQSCKLLEDVVWSDYEDILFVGKSIGTVVATKYAREHNIVSHMILYTPVEATFRAEIKDAVAFIGEADPWSDLNMVKELAKNQGVLLYTYPECNHSLEKLNDTEGNIDILGKVMKISGDYIASITL